MGVGVRICGLYTTFTGEEEGKRQGKTDDFLIRERERKMDTLGKEIAFWKDKWALRKYREMIVL